MQLESEDDRGPGGAPPTAQKLPKFVGLPLDVLGMFWHLKAGQLPCRVLKNGRKAGGFDGGRWWDRTTDPYDVNVVLSR
jgi:hypothetical protein